MCCDGWDMSDLHKNQCPQCDGDVTSDGQATTGLQS